MSFLKFEHSMPRSPDAQEAYGRLRTFLEREKVAATSPKVFSTNRMFDVAGGVSAFALVQALTHLVSEGLVEQLVRVEPKFGEGIGDFESLEEVPETLADWRNPGRHLRVRPEHLQVYYKLVPVGTDAR